MLRHQSLQIHIGEHQLAVTPADELIQQPFVANPIAGLKVITICLLQLE